MKKYIYVWCSGFSLLLLMPYLAVILINGVKTAFLNRTPDKETFLPMIVADQINEKNQAETICAQSVIARTNLYRKLQDGEELPEILRERDVDPVEILTGVVSGKYIRAVEKTRGKILTCDGELKLVPYHEISSGKTRDGAEAFHDEKYTYLKSVDSTEDRTAEKYLTAVYIAEDQLPQEFKISKRDRAGYVTELLADGNTLEGENFRQGMNLASGNFSLQKIGDQYRFLCKGQGHGLGFSQYGGNELAKNGSNWEELLEKYFPAMEIAEVNF